MNVQLINEKKTEFAQYLQEVFLQQKSEEIYYKWDVIDSWQQHFEMDFRLLSESIDKAMKSDFSRSLWGGEKHSIKSGIRMLCEENAIFMEAAFQNLFDENKDISMRFNRFLFHCDELLETIHKRDDRINTHYQDEYAVSLYLSLQYPDKYCPFNYEVFHPFMEKIGSRNIPVAQDKERYYKIMNALYTVISKDGEFMNGFNFILQQALYKGKSLFLIHDLMNFVEAE